MKKPNPLIAGLEQLDRKGAGAANDASPGVAKGQSSFA